MFFYCSRRISLSNSKPPPRFIETGGKSNPDFYTLLGETFSCLISSY
jgi:hypothetical protein